MITGVVTVAVLWRGPPGERPESTRNFARLAPIMEALSEAGLSVEPMLYADEQSDVVLDRLLSFQAVLVWADPIDGADTRIVLDATLRRASEAGVWVSAHPNTIDKIGTKEVLYRSKSLRWGMDTHLYTSAAALRSELPSRLADGATRVLKRGRGNGGVGVWKVSALDTVAGRGLNVRVQHAAPRDFVTEDLALDVFVDRCLEDGADTYFCEINVSSVLPFPAGAPAAVARTVADRLGAASP